VLRFMPRIDGEPAVGPPVSQEHSLARFHKVAGVEEVPPGTGKVVHVLEESVALFNVGGRFHAVSNTCPHQGGPLGEGILDGCVVTCPWHFWQFDVTKGHAPEFPEMTIDRFVVKVDGGAVYVSDTPLGRTGKAG